MNVIKPQSILDNDSGIIVPVVNLDQVQLKVNKILKQFMESIKTGDQQDLWAENS